MEVHFATDLAEVKHLEAAEGHQHPATRELASFLRNIQGIQQDPESMVYITAVGGVPFANYIQGPSSLPLFLSMARLRCHGVLRNPCTGFIQRALKVGLSALVIACMDSIALQRCSQVATWLGGVGIQTAKKKRTHVLFHR